MYVILLHQTIIKIQNIRTQDVDSLSGKNLFLLERKNLSQISIIEASIDKWQTVDHSQEYPPSTSQLFVLLLLPLRPPSSRTSFSLFWHFILLLTNDISSRYASSRRDIPPLSLVDSFTYEGYLLFIPILALSLI